MTSPFATEQLIEDTQFLFPEKLPPEKLEKFHKENLKNIGNLGEKETVYLIIGNYSKPQIERLNKVSDILSSPANDLAYKLNSIDPNENIWQNFYVKFKVFLKRSDYIIGVVEDNDGGHELELGEVPLDNTYVLKRDYSNPSIDEDLENQKYDAMIGTMFQLLEQRGHLFEWTSKDELKDVAQHITNQFGSYEE